MDRQLSQFSRTDLSNGNCMTGKEGFTCIVLPRHSSSRWCYIDILTMLHSQIIYVWKHWCCYAYTGWFWYLFLYMASKRIGNDIADIIFLFLWEEVTNINMIYESTKMKPISQKSNQWIFLISSPVLGKAPFWLDSKPRTFVSIPFSWICQ